MPLVDLLNAFTPQEQTMCHQHTRAKKGRARGSPLLRLSNPLARQRRANEYVAEDSDTPHATHGFLCDELSSRATYETRIPDHSIAAGLMTFHSKEAAATNCIFVRRTKPYSRSSGCYSRSPRSPDHRMPNPRWLPVPTRHGQALPGIYRCLGMPQAARSAWLENEPP